MIEFLFNNPFLAFILISLIVGFFNDSSKKAKQKTSTETESTTSETRTNGFEELLLEFNELIDSGDYTHLQLEEMIETELFFLTDDEKAILKNKLTLLDRSKDQVAEVVSEVKETAESLRNKQYEELLQRYDVKTDIDIAVNKAEEKLVSHNKIKENDLTKQLKGRITAQGLRESIVMNEILGKPRALKPYEKRY